MLSYKLFPDLYKSDAEDIIRLFFPSYKSDGDFQNNIIQTVTASDKTINNHVVINFGESSKEYSYNNGIDSAWDTIIYKRHYKRFLKHSLYLSMKDFFGADMPWGSLTGIRPTRIAYNYLGIGAKIDELETLLIKDYAVSQSKAALIKDIVISQKDYYCQSPKDLILYVNIPVCKTRCNYCSFISSVYSRCAHLMDEYIRLLADEIKHCIDLAGEKGLKIKSVYIGGGTPTVVGKEKLEIILKAINTLPSLSEFTVEAGRADSIDNEILDLLKKYSVTRISINPQSFNDKTLQEIGRAHTSDDVYRAYELALPYGFTINMDLIAGLSGENLSDFSKSVEEAISLKPHNITVHTLCLKGGSRMKEKGMSTVNGHVPAMIEYAQDRLYQSGYSPYYLYRQKYAAGNAENTGWTLHGYACAYNIYAMEEITSVAACGAGAISKIIASAKFERLANFKNIEDYIARYQETIDEKELFFDALTRGKIKH